MPDQRRQRGLRRETRRADNGSMTIRPVCPRRCRPLACRSARGFTLLEVLVAVLVLSFGVLGVVGLQAASLQANKDARNQSAAVRLGRELGDMMRGNKDVAIETSAANNPYLLENFTGTVAASSLNCVTAACTSAKDVATFEMHDWLTRLAADLPGVRAVVCFDAAPYDAAGLPRWECTDNGGTAVVKLGWTRGATKRDATASEPLALDRASRPSILMPLIAGSVQ